MKRNLPLLAVVIWVALGLTLAQAQDNGVPDTLYLEVYPGDDSAFPLPADVRLNLRVTNDIPDPVVDSVACMVIPLSFTSTNPSANAEIQASKNHTQLYPLPDLNNSIFRHMPDMYAATERNWMMDLSEQLIGLEWDTRILDIGTGDHFWLSMVSSGSTDQKFPGGSRLLTATMTLTIADTTTICVDTCFWPPTGHLAFSRSDAVTYFPQIWDDYIPAEEYCVEFYIWIPSMPHFVDGVDNQTHSFNGYYVTDDFTVVDEYNTITSLWAQFSGEGVEDISIYTYKSPTKDVVTGYVEYEVTDHCEAAGTVTITAINEWGAIGTDDFWIALTNAPPVMKLPDTLLVHAGNTALLETSALDANGDPVEIALDGFWYEPDSLQPPTNEPYYDGENPGFFSWLTAEADSGTWICLISATDICGAADVEQVTIRVGVPFCGEANGDGILDLGDLVFLIGFLYKGGQPPDPLCKGDANCDGIVQISDVVALINYLFRSGPLPCFDCCPSGS
jgi:hypothetical protein